MGKDNDYLGKLQDYYATHKVMPSYQAIADLLGFKSKKCSSCFGGTVEITWVY